MPNYTYMTQFISKLITSSVEKMANLLSYQEIQKAIKDTQKQLTKAAATKKKVPGKKAKARKSPVESDEDNDETESASKELRDKKMSKKYQIMHYDLTDEDSEIMEDHMIDAAIRQVLSKHMPPHVLTKRHQSLHQRTQIFSLLD